MLVAIMSTNMKIALCVLILAAWGIFVLQDHTLVAEFIKTLKEILIALGAFQVGASAGDPKS